jgi:Big-like domain-containing protein
VKLLAFAVAALAALVPLHAAASGADFVAASANPGASFATAADFNTVAVTLTDPGTMRGTVALAATAASDRGIAKVTFQTSPAGAGTWTDACTATTSPYTCAFDSTTTADGLKDVRAVATDGAGYARTATLTSRRVDNTAPATALTDPGTPLTGSKTLTATASDAGSGLASVALQYRPSGGAWTTICAAATCTLNTATLADGAYDLRSLATDAAGNTSTSVVSARTLDNTAPTASLALPTYVRGTFTLAATTGDGNGSGVASVTYQMRPTGTSTWNVVCTTSTAPFSCTGDTSATADGIYDVRAVATDRAGFSTTTTPTATTRLDNTAPAVTLTDPGSPLSGPVTLTAAATDAGSGVATVKLEVAPAGTTTWTTVCTDATAPYSCSLSTTTLADGLYDLHAIATDAAGNAATSTVTSRRVDNNGPTLSLTDPGSPIRNTASIAATASDPAGVASVKIERKPSAGSTWTALCTDTTGPYSCPLTGLADGTYDFRATATDTLGHTSTATLTSRTVDSTAPKANDVQAVNGTGTANRIDAGDVITFTFSEPVAPASILAGWTGASTAVRVHVTDGGTLDTLNLWDAANTTKLNLGDVALKADRASVSTGLAATMTMSGSTVTVTLGAGIAKTATGTSTMVWTPSTAVTDLAGNAMSATAATETGTTDVDF